MKVALVYDRVNKWGGAERVLLAFHELFPDAPLYTSVYNPETAPWASAFTIKTSFLQNLSYFRNKHELLPLLMPIAFESFIFDEYDLVISITSEFAKAIITKPGTKHICYCLTPTRYLWSGYDEYFKNKVLRTSTKFLIRNLRKWDRIAAQRPDAYIAISKEVQGRIKKYYGRESEVVYPPVSLQNSRFKIQDLRINKKEQYFLIVSRLVRYKRIDLAIRACNELQFPLKIIGIGSEEKRLRTIAGPTIEFVGSVDEETLARYYSQCQALLFPGYEDFGLAMVEAQLFGKPVIAFHKGGAEEIVLHGKTGLLFDSQTVASLSSVLGAFEKNDFDKEVIMKHAAQFNKEHFKKAFLSELKKLL